ncbi:MAG: ParB N-terminal domain-containing protein [Selenomonadaceae bacterium]|nr:ParB N-terminal domain-containing protein [Selenomonadaceae bacterium]
MNIVDKPVDSLIPYENNPRKNGAAVKPVMNSIKQFGFKVPIVVDSSDVVVAGHTRLLAAKELGMEKVPCIVADDLTEDQINAFRLADNKVSELSSWDFGKLEEELARMEIAEIDMEQFGFSSLISDDDISDFFDSHEPEEETHETKKHTVTCPHCGEVFEP